MSDAELLAEEVRTLPVNFAGKVLEFIENLKHEGATESRALPPAYSPDDALKVSALKIADPNRKPISRYFGCLKNSKAFVGDPLEIQRQMRAEWDRE